MAQRSDVRAHDAAWAKISIGADVGISGFTVTKLHSLLRRVNAERPPTHRHDESEIAVRLLECINENSKLFGAESLSEINSTGPHNGYFWIAGTAAGVGGVHPAVPARRDLARLVAHYSTHWKNAFENGHLGPEQLPTASGRRASSQSVGLSTEAKAAAMQVEAMQMELHRIREVFFSIPLPFSLISLLSPCQQKRKEQALFFIQIFL